MIFVAEHYADFSNEATTTTLNAFPTVHLVCRPFRRCVKVSYFPPLPGICPPLCRTVDSENDWRISCRCLGYLGAVSTYVVSACTQTTSTPLEQTRWPNGFIQPENRRLDFGENHNLTPAVPMPPPIATAPGLCSLESFHWRRSFLPSRFLANSLAALVDACTFRPLKEPNDNTSAHSDR
jgi:hypothetical protein